MKPEIRLSCAQCRTRKKKCDKGAPCSACREAGLACEVVQRARLPRGRSAKARSQNAQLEDRLARIEKLLQQAREPATTTATTTTTTTTSKTDFSEAPVSRRSPNLDSHSKEKLNRYVASDFWTVMSREVAGLRDVLEVSDDEDISDSFSPDKQNEDFHDVDDVLFPGVMGAEHIFAPQAPSKSVRAALFEVFQRRIHCLFNLLHLPTFMRDVNALHSGQCPTPRVTAALEDAILFIAVCALSEQESINLGLGPKALASQQYQRAAQISLSRAGLLVMPNLAVLQAFILYLYASRACQTRASTWILLSVAVRLATALGLGDEDPEQYNSFDLEIRRRVWYQIGVMDSHAGLDRGTTLMLPLALFKHPPLDLNDIDLIPGIEPEANRSGMTDMSMSIIGIEAMVAHRKILEPPPEGVTQMDHWLYRVAVVNDMKEVWRKRYPESDEPLPPFQKLATLTTVEIALDLEVQLRRPPIRLAWHFVPPDDDFNILERTTNVMERSLRLDEPEIAVWNWKIWVKWYALAILLAELCSNPDPALADRAYAVAKEGFARFAPIIAEGESGLLWRPIAKLMHRVDQSKLGNNAPADLAHAKPQEQSAFDYTHMTASLQCQPQDSAFNDLFPTTVSDIAVPISQPAISMDLNTAWSDASYPTTCAPNDMSWQTWNLFLEDMSRTVDGNTAPPIVNGWNDTNYNAWAG